MGWVIEIAKLLLVCAVTAIVLAMPTIVGVGNSKATGLDLLFRFTGSRLAMVGVLNLVIGLVLTRLSVISDAAGRWHFSLR
jgi:hypothetical protein